MLGKSIIKIDLGELVLAIYNLIFSIDFLSTDTLYIAYWLFYLAADFLLDFICVQGIYAAHTFTVAIHKNPLGFSIEIEALLPSLYQYIFNDMVNVAFEVTPLILLAELLPTYIPAIMIAVSELGVLAAFD